MQTSPRNGSSPGRTILRPLLMLLTATPRLMLLKYRLPRRSRSIVSLAAKFDRDTSEGETGLSYFLEPPLPSTSKSPFQAHRALMARQPLIWMKWLTSTVVIGVLFIAALLATLCLLYLCHHFNRWSFFGCSVTQPPRSLQLPGFILMHQ